ncbi:MAG: hypothetical protein CMF52_08965 [Legionellales bacterium]|nr:hypothetical protein [Legionellales bacterium]
MSFSSYAGTITENPAGSVYTSDSSQEVTSSPFVRFIAFSQNNNGDASNSADFALTLDAADLVYFSKFKQDTTYVTLAAGGPILFPVATFQMCVESNVKDLTSSNYLKASVTNNQLSGSGANTSSTINLYVMLVGNGSGTNGASATQYCTFGTATSDIKRYANSTAVNNSTGELDTTTTAAASLMTNAWTTASGGVSLVASGGSQNHTEVSVTVGNTGDCKLLHYGVSSTNTNPSPTDVSDPNGTDYEVDISRFTDNTCGSSNANAVTAYVYADIRDFQSVPADTYSGNIQVGFSYATS